MTQLSFGSALTIAALLLGLFGAAQARDRLEGTTWQLQRFISMDDTTLTPDDPAKYTLNFVGDGRLAVGADCNRGHAGWSSPGIAELKIGPVAATKMLCGKGSMSDRFLRDQPAWLKARNACIGKLAATLCTRDHYIDRIVELRDQSKEALLRAGPGKPEAKCQEQIIG